MNKVILVITIIFALNTLFLPNVFAETNTSPPDIVSEAAIIIDSETGTILYEKSANEQMYPASLTKIATAIYAIENGNLNDIVTVSKKARSTGGTKVYLEEGERVTLEKLIQGLLINSGNDAGVAIAEHLSGSIEGFSNDLNEFLINKIGVKNTQFENPHGLFDPEHVTTAKDLAKITQYAIKNKTFREIFGTKEMEWKGESWDTTLYTHHKLMREIPYDGITGGKTGFVPQSGFTLATTAERGNMSLIVITLNSYNQEGSYSDTINLLDYGFNNFETSTIGEGSIFTVDNKKYKTSSKIIYTHSINEQVSRNVNNNGELEIINENGDVISSYPLNKVERNLSEEQKINELSTGINEKNTGLLFGGHLLEFLFVMLVSLIIVGGFIYHTSQIMKKIRTSNGTSH